MGGFLLFFICTNRIDPVLERDYRVVEVYKVELCGDDGFAHAYAGNKTVDLAFDVKTPMRQKGVEQEELRVWVPLRRVVLSKSPRCWTWP